MKFARVITSTACVFALLPVAQSEAATRFVEIPGRYYQPSRVTITVGGTVRWTNSSGERHTVTSSSDSSERFTSSNNCRGSLLFNDCIRPDGSYAHTFTEHGTFTYYCQLHGSDGRFPNCGMCGRVTVVRRSSSGTVAPTTPGSVSPTVTASATSPSPSSNVSASPSPSTISTTPIAGGPDGGGSTPIVAIAAVAVVLLGGSGFLIYRTMIR